VTRPTTRRQRLTLRELAAALAIATAGAGVALAAGFVVWRVLVPPAPPAAPAPARPPAVGDLVHAGTDSAVVLEALPAGGAVLVAVHHVRGRLHGRRAYRVTGCPAGGELVDLATGAGRRWHAAGSGIDDAAARVACAAVLVPARPEGAA
jgi:hypothetical protein